MPRKLTVVYGGQYGSEGKGQLTAKLITSNQANMTDRPVAAVRVGGPNAGHTAIAADGKEIKAQSIPIPMFVSRRVTGFIGPAGVILMEILQAEIKRLEQIWGDTPPLLFIDSNASVITDEQMARETEMKQSIGSTGEGVGAATADKVMRKAPNFADWWNNGGKDKLPHWIIMRDVPQMLSEYSGDVLVEGTQGYHLSLNTGRGYPFLTSRDCGPEAIMGQIGINPRQFEKVNIICVLRTHPIRVGGNSGHLPREIDWETLMERTGGYIKVPERTTVTKKIRRIAEWDEADVARTISETNPTEIALTFLDYVFPEVANMTDWTQLPNNVMRWLDQTQKEIGVPIRWISTGFGQEYTFQVAPEGGTPAQPKIIGER